MMMKRLTIGLAAAALLANLATAEPIDGIQTYDMLFKEGTLDEIDRTSALIYDRTVSNALKPEAAERDTGQIALSFKQTDTDAMMAMLDFRQAGKHRSLGSFPASVGNPMIMYFYETVVRDMADAAGGSPNYIRNRVKEALITPSEVVAGETMFDGRKITTQTISMRPFSGDPNVDRMQGFGDLELRVTMSEDVPGWYMSLVAQAGDVYSSALTFGQLGDSQ